MKIKKTSIVFSIGNFYGIRSFITMKKDKVVDDGTVTGTYEEESCVTDRAMKKDSDYVVASDGPHQIITQVQWIDKNSSHNYDEWEKAIQMELRSKWKLRFLD